MTSFFSHASSSRQGAVQNLAAGEVSEPFGPQTNQIRLAASADTYFLVSEAANPTVATTTNGSLMPGEKIDYIAVTPGQVISATAALNVTEMG